MVAVNMLAYVNKIWPQETLVGASLADRPYTVFYTQYAAAVFYRLLVGKRLNLTADLQYIRDPAINPLENTIWVFGLRGRLAF